MGKEQFGIWTMAMGLTLASASPARAIDPVAGLYEGKVTCQISSNGLTSKLKTDVAVAVVDGGSNSALLSISAGGNVVGDTVVAILLEDQNQADRARVAGVDCNLESSAITGVAFHADVVIKAGSQKGTLKGSYQYTDGVGLLIQTCTFSAKRTSLTPPQVDDCVM